MDYYLLQGSCAIVHGKTKVDTELPTPSANLPAGHASHSPPGVWHSAVELPAALDVPTGQGTQGVGPVVASDTDSQVSRQASPKITPTAMILTTIFIVLLHHFNILHAKSDNAAVLSQTPVMPR
eukprot:5183077-Amphidinium_carterae.1